MLLRQGRLQGQQHHRCTLDLANVRPRLCRARHKLPAGPIRTRAGPVAAAEAVDAPAADRKARMKRAPRKKSPEEDVGEQGMPDLPMPLDYQQTLVKSFTLAGIGLHSAEYAVVRVRPAFAGEGRYFVRVPDGTNGGRFVFDGGNLEDEVPLEEYVIEEPVPEEVEDQKVEWFTAYLAAQEEEGFVGTFNEYTDIQVQEGNLDANLRLAMLGITETADSMEPEVEPDLAMEPEEVVPLDPSDPSLVRASIGYVKELELPYTQLGEGDNRVMSVELLLAALEASGVDNARIEIEGGHEVPVLDNSALGWCIDIQCAGLRAAPLKDADDSEEITVAQRDMLMPSQAIAVQDEEGWISFFPGPFARLTAGIDHSVVAPVIGSQWFTWDSDDVHFRYSLAPARAYAESVEELFDLRDAGYVQAGAENLFLIAAGDQWWDPSLVRMVYDEPVRYKLTQLIGNLALLGVGGSQGIPVGHITAYNASPALQLSFVQTMLASVEKEDYTTFLDVIERQDAWLVAKYGGEEFEEEGARRMHTSVGGFGEDWEEEDSEEEDE